MCGEYGCGKSYILFVMRYVVRNDGFFILKVEVDGESISFFNLLKFLNMLFLSV